MIARHCDRCEKAIVQANGECIELTLRVLDTTKDDGQDAIEQFYADFCDDCIHDGSALALALNEIGWTLGRGRTPEKPGAVS